MRVAITGASGLIGTALSVHLRANNHEVAAIRRTKSTSDDLYWDPTGTMDGSQLVGFDAVIHLAGAGIGARRWSKEYRQEIYNSRVNSTELLATTLANLTNGPSILISGSAVGYYGSSGDEMLDEESDPGTGFIAELVQDWEAATAPATQAGIVVSHIRTGIVLSSHGGALAKMLPLFKFGLGGRFGDGQQWMSWISIADQVRAIEFILTNRFSGTYNLTAPNPVRNTEFASALASVLSRPSALAVPAFAPRALLGREMANTLLLEGQRVNPKCLQEVNFKFGDYKIIDTLHKILSS